jgi:PIN domain nuclease of toxin-antitoxin system
MNLLLDTHVLIWSLLDPDRLSRVAAELLEDVDTKLHVSPITAWECIVLAEKGRLVLEPNPVEWVRKRLRELAPKEVAITTEVAIRSRELDLGTADPADRFLAATASVFDLVLLTADQRLLSGEGFASIPAG